MLLPNQPAEPKPEPTEPTPEAAPQPTEPTPEAAPQPTEPTPESLLCDLDAPSLTGWPVADGLEASPEMLPSIELIPSPEAAAAEEALSGEERLAAEEAPPTEEVVLDLHSLIEATLPEVPSQEEVVPMLAGLPFDGLTASPGASESACVPLTESSEPPSHPTLEVPVQADAPGSVPELPPPAEEVAAPEDAGTSPPVAAGTSAAEANRLTSAFRRAAREGRQALLPLLTAGWPSPEAFLQRAAAAVEAGADVLVILLPYSDPVAEAAPFAAESRAAAQSGIGFGQSLELLGKVSACASVPVVVRCYYNLILRGSMEARCADLVAAGVAAVTVPDLPFEESSKLRATATAQGLDVVFPLSTSTSTARLAQIVEHSQGMAYISSHQGTEQVEGLASLARRVRERSSLPICADRVLSTAEDVAKLREDVDGCLIGGCYTAQAAADAPAASSETITWAGWRTALTRAASAPTPGGFSPEPGS